MPTKYTKLLSVLTDKAHQLTYSNWFAMAARKPPCVERSLCRLQTTLNNERFGLQDPLMSSDERNSQNDWQPSV